MLQPLPRVTVLIANHNYQQWVVESIQSAANQTYNNVSIVFVDDGSTDESWSNVHNAFFKKFAHTKTSVGEVEKKSVGIQGKYGEVLLEAYRLPKNVGPSAARNFGIEQSIKDTPVYCILDADDMMKENKVTRLMSEMLLLPDLIGVVYADYDVMNMTTGITLRENKEVYSKDRLLQNCIVHSGSLVSSKALLTIKDQFGFYDSQMRVAEDWDLWLRVSHNFMMLHVPESLSIVRSTQLDSSHTVPQEIWAQCRQRIQVKLTSR